MTMQSYRILAIGVNRAKGQDPLEFAEKDATDIVNVFTGGLGPPGARATSLLGATATRANVIAELDALAAQRPDRLLLFFSGHGSPQAIYLADQPLCYDCIARRLRNAEARSTVVLLDNCYAGAFARSEWPDDVGDVRVGGVDEDLAWLKRLVAARKGHRVLLATSATTRARENKDVKNGRFTAGVLHTLRTAPADLWQDGVGFISDAALFNGASRYMKQRFGKDQIPTRLGTLGDFPMVRSQLEKPVGWGAVQSFALTNSYAATALCTLVGRKHVPTTVRFSLFHTDGTLISAKAMTDVPATDPYEPKYSVNFDGNVLSQDPRARSALAARWPVVVSWCFELADEHGHVLARQCMDYQYAIPAAIPPSAWTP